MLFPPPLPFSLLLPFFSFSLPLPLSKIPEIHKDKLMKGKKEIPYNQYIQF